MSLNSKYFIFYFFNNFYLKKLKEIDKILLLVSRFFLLFWAGFPNGYGPFKEKTYSVNFQFNRFISYIWFITVFQPNKSGY